MRFRKSFSTTLLTLALAGSSALTLETGKPPPAFVPMKWFNGKGADPSRPDGRHVYIVEFWTSNSPECRQAIPVFNRLHRQYHDKGLLVMGVTCEKAETLALFMADAPMAHPVAFDPEAGTTRAYLGDSAAFPYAVIINRKGLVVWQGPPLPHLPEVIRQVMAGNFDPEQETRVRKLEESIHGLARSGKVNRMMTVLDQLIRLRPHVHRYYGLKARLLSMTGRKDEVQGVFTTWAKGCADSAEGLGALADTLVENQDKNLRNPDLALQYAKKALILSRGKDLRAYITLAKIYAEIGLFQKAVTILQQGRKVPGFKQSETIDRLQKYYRKLQAAREKERGLSSPRK